VRAFIQKKKGDGISANDAAKLASKAGVLAHLSLLVLFDIE
jgi:hypothetical protein